MIIHMAAGATPEQTQRVIDRIQPDYGLRCETIVGDTTVIGVKGIAAVIDEGRITELPGVERVIRITEKFKDASRIPSPRTRLSVWWRAVGGDHLTIFGGPCAIESEQQALDSCAHGDGCWRRRTARFRRQVAHEPVRLPRARNTTRAGGRTWR